MRRIRTGLPLAVAAVAILALPAAATAKPGYIRLPRSFSASLDLPRSNGYRLQVYSIGHRQVYLIASGHGSTATYLTRGFAGRNRVAANLGRFGRIDVRLGPTQAAPPRREIGNCRGKPMRERRGVARGRIEFHGLGEFASASVRSARATVVQTFERVCKREPGTSYFTFDSSSYVRRRAFDPPRLQAKSDMLFARGEVGGKRVEFSATGFGLLDAGGFVDAVASRRFGRIVVAELGSAIYEGDEFSITQGGPHPNAAIVRGVGPFAGESYFYRTPGGASTWTGSLTVDLPGEGRVPLSGPGFDAELCRRSFSSATGSCQGSGSQAQSLFETRLSWSR